MPSGIAACNTLEVFPLTAEQLYYAALERAPHPLDDPYRPATVASAAAQAVGAAGASLSTMVGELRVPLGASDADADRAERVQFTLGIGPCIEAAASGTMIDAPATELDRRWPDLARQWREATPYRSAASFPIVIDGVMAALNFFMISPDGCASLDDTDLETVMRLVAESLKIDERPGDWAAVSPRIGRGQVWVALGMLRAHFGGSGDDALADLRSYAAGANLDVDAVAHQLVDLRLPLEDIVEERGA